MVNPQNYSGGGGQRTEITNAGRGEHRTYFVDGGNNWGGDTAQHGKKKLSCGWVGGGDTAYLGGYHCLIRWGVVQARL